MSTGIIILAAGDSTRMGTPKQLLAWNGTSLLRHAISQALALPNADVVVVLGAKLDAMRREIGDLPALVVENPNWREGMGSSLRAGLRALLDTQPGTEAVIFHLCDQPLVSAAIMEALAARHRESGCALVASEYGGTLGVPALFDRSLFPELLALGGAEGARQVIRRHCALAAAIPFPGGEIDIDTADDYARLIAAHETSIPAHA